MIVLMNTQQPSNLSPTVLLNHTFCLRCDQKEFSLTEINEHLVIDYTAGDLICGKCGEILSEHLIHSGNEVVAYNEDAENGIDKQMRSSGRGDYFGSEETIFLNGPENVRKSLERAQRTIVTRKEKTILGNINLVQELCAKMNLTTAIKAKAVEIFIETLKSATMIMKVEVIAAVSVYLACRVEGYPRLLDEVSTYSGIDPKELRRIQGGIARRLSLLIGVMKPADIVNRMGDQLNLSFHQRQLAFETCGEIARYELFDVSPPQLVVAGVIAWICVLTKMEQDCYVAITELCRVCFVPIGAVGKIFRELHEYLPIIVPNQLSSLVKACHPRLSSKLENHLNSSVDKSEAYLVFCKHMTLSPSTGTLSPNPPASSSSLSNTKKRKFEKL